MAQTSFALLTNTGRQKEAAALGNGTALVVTHIGIGDGATVPSGGETQLYHEVLRKTISGQGVVAGATNVAYADIFLAADEGPFTIREAGLFDSSGALIAIAHYDPPVNKPVPGSGQTVEGIVRIEVAFSNVETVTIMVDPAISVALQRLSNLPWVPVISKTVTAPPASPPIGATYLVPAGATGSWTGQSDKIAEFTSAGWAFISPKDGHGIGLPDGRAFIRKGGVYVELGSGRLINVQRITENGTYVRTPGAMSALVEGVGGGGGGAGTPATGANTYACAGGGAPGSYAIAWIPSIPASVPVTIGAAGAGGVGANGENGGTTSFGSLLTLPGGGGGFQISGTGRAVAGYGNPSGAPSGTGIIVGFSTGVSPNDAYQIPAIDFSIGGHGGSNPLGAGGGSTNPRTATGFGGGGGGTSNLPNQVTSVGGSGTAGIIIIYEYA